MQTKDATKQKEIEICLTRWLALQGKYLESASHGVIRYTPGNSDSSLHFFWSSKDDGSRLECINQLDRTEKEGKGVVSRQTGDAQKEKSSVLISYPIELNDSSTFTAAFHLHNLDEPLLQKAMIQLQFGLRWLSEYNLNHAQSTDRPNANPLELLQTDLYSSDSAANAQKIAAKLAKEFCCDQVSICYLKNTKLHVLATSNQAAPIKKSAIVDANLGACEECIDQLKTIVYPGSGGDHLSIKRAHEKIAQNFGRQQLLSIPLLRDKKHPVGAILFERSDDNPFTEKEQDTLEQISAMIGPTLHFQHNSESPLRHLLSQRIEEKLSNNIYAESPLKKAIYLLILVCCVSLFFIKGDFIVSAEGTVTGKIHRAIIAPFPGYIAEAHNRAGDKVKEGTLLAALDTDELTLEQLKWASLKVEKELEYRKAIAQNLTAPAKIMLEQKKQAEIQLELLEMQKQRTRIIAPFDGLLVKGDLSQTIGSPVDRGQVLFEIVPDETFRIHLDVDEKDIDPVAVGQKGTLIVNALPSQKFHFTVDQITPVSTPQHGKNSFRVEGHLDSGSGQLSPGMKGYGKVVITRKSLLWIWTRPLRTQLRLLLWSSTS